MCLKQIFLGTKNFGVLPPNVSRGYGLTSREKSGEEGSHSVGCTLSSAGQQRQNSPVTTTYTVLLFQLKRELPASIPSHFLQKLCQIEVQSKGSAGYFIQPLVRRLQHIIKLHSQHPH